MKVVLNVIVTIHTNTGHYRFIDTITFSDILAKNLQVMDSTAASLCKDNKLDLIVFNMNKKGNITKAVKGEKIGTYVSVK